MEIMKEDVNKNSDDMLVPLNKKSKKCVGGKKLSDNVSIVPFDNVSFHSEDSV